MLAQFHAKVPMHFVSNDTNTTWQSETETTAVTVKQEMSLTKTNGVGL